jgi:hypothetical protein
MGYATVADVEVYSSARAPFTANSKPSATAVAAIVGQTNARIDTVLTLAGYDTPIASTATVAFELVRGAAAVCAAAMVERAAPTSDRIAHYQEMCNEALKALATSELPGVDRSTTQGSVRFQPDPTPSPMFALDMDL